MPSKIPAKITTRESEQERVYAELRDSIVLGKFLPGERLTEERVAKAFDTSRSTVRLCFSMLERDGIVSQQPTHGFYVSKISFDETLELLEARSRIESYTGGLAARKISGSCLKELESLLSQMKTSIEEGKFAQYSLLNTEFHSLIYKSSGNKGLEYVSLQLKTRIIRLQYKIAYIRGRPERSLLEHREIFDALKSRDAERTEYLIREHIEGIKQLILENYGLLEA